MHSLWLRIRMLGRRRQLARDLEDELSFHVAMRRDKSVEAGIPPTEAGAAARQAFGSTLSAGESLRELWTFRWIEQLLQDLVYAGRSFRKNPVFVLASVVSLALGIGAVTTVYAIGYSFLWRPMPVDNPHQLVALYQTA